MRLRIAVATLAALLALVGCKADKSQGETKPYTQVSAGSWDAEKEIRRGTWETLRPCKWTIKKRDGSDKHTGSGRKFFIEPGQIVDTEDKCEQLNWVAYEDQTRQCWPCQTLAVKE